MAEGITLANLLLPLILTTLAGLSTGIGSAIAYFMKKPKLTWLSFFMGLSGGVMIYVSFVELLPGSFASIGHLWSLGAFFLGMIIIGLIDLLIPEPENPHPHSTSLNSMTCGMSKAKKHLMNVGLFTALAIGIHNLPEGLAIFASAYSNLELGILVCVAIAIHNIPEGIAVSVPIFCATGDRKKAFYYSFISGIAEPVGGLVGFLLLSPFMTTWFISFLMVFVAGIMVYISIDKILPTAISYDRSHLMIIGMATGMFVMAMSILIM